jgi:hypothetical protein
MATGNKSVSTNPILGEQWSSSRVWQLVTVSSDGKGDLTLREKTCLLKIKTGAPETVSISVSQASIDNAKASERHVKVSASKPGTPFVSDVATSVRGANLCDPVNDPLPDGSVPSDEPRSCDDPCTGLTCDLDEDRHTGFTTSVKSSIVNCDIYSAARTAASLKGSVKDTNLIAGSLADRKIETLVYGATNDLCKQGGAPLDDGCDTHHYFQMVRLPDGVTCSAVLELTDCDEDELNCDADDELPLDPRLDAADDCK